MKTFSIAQRPLMLMLGVAFSANFALSAHAQSQSYRPNKPQSGLVVSSASTDSRAAITLKNLTRVLPGFWASTEPSKAYMISNTMVRRAADGSITFMEETGPYKFDPSVTPEVLMKNGPRFVDLLLGHYATQETLGLNELTAALAEYFESTRPGQGSSIPGGQLMRNSDGSATFTDGKIIFVFDATTSAATVAIMAPALAAGLTPYGSAIMNGASPSGYALRDPANVDRLINYDGRTYDTAGNYHGPANPNTVSALFGGSNGAPKGNASSGAGASPAGGSSGTGGSSLGTGSGSGGGSNGSGSNASGGSSPTASGNPSGSTGGGSGWGSSGGSPSGSTGNAASGGTAPTATNNAGSTSGSNPTGTNNSGGSTANPSGSSAASPNGSNPGNGTTPTTAGNNPGYNPQSGVNGQGLGGTAPLSSTGMGTMNSNYGVAPAANPCTTFRMLGGSGGSSCN